MNTESKEHTGADAADAAGVPRVPEQVQLPWQYTYTCELQVLRGSSRHIGSGEINVAARLSWRVYQTPAYFFLADATDAQPVASDDGVVISAENGSFKLVGSRRAKAAMPAPDCFFNVRDDVHQVVGIVKRRYRILQNADAPLFLDHLVDSGDALFETAGALHGGARVFWLVRLEGPSAETGSERLDSYLLLENSHDGSKSFGLSTFAVHPVSQTTLVWSLPSVPRALRLRHTTSANDRRVTSRQALDLGATYASELVAIRDRMLQTVVSAEQFRDFLAALIPTPKPIVKGDRIANQRGVTMASNAKGVITQIYHHNERYENIRGTLWGVVQACEFYSNHMSISRNTDDSTANDNRLKRLLSEATLGGKAFSQALKLL